MSDAGDPSASWDEVAAGWDDEPAVRAYADAAHRSLQSVLARRGRSARGMEVCDFGCGTGLLTERLVDQVASITAVDTSPAMRDVLTSKAERQGWSTVAVVAELPTGTERYDLTICSSVCGFLDDYPGIVARFGELLRPGGLFVQWDWERDEGAPEGDGLSRAEIGRALLAAGLEEIVVTTAFEVDLGGTLARPLLGVGQKPGVSTDER